MPSENPIQINHRISISLNEENYQEKYQQWGREVVNILRNNCLEGYLDGTITIDYEPWKKQDEEIFFWLLSNLSPGIVSELSHKFIGTAALLWKNLRQMFFDKYFPVVRNLRVRLQSVKKNDTTCDHFLQQIQVLADKLNQAGSFIDCDMIVHYTLEGLGQEFEPFVTIVTTLSKAEPLTMIKLHRLILDEEARLFSLPQPPTVHNPGEDSSQPSTSKSVPVTNANAGPSQEPLLLPSGAEDTDDFASSLLNID